LYNIWNSPYCLTQHCILQFTSTSLLITQKFVRAFYHTSINNNPISSSAVNGMNKDVIWASWIPASMSFVIAFLCHTDFNAGNFEQRFKQMTTGVWHRYALARERERERGGNAEFSVTDLIYYAIFCTCSSDSITLGPGNTKMALLHACPLLAKKLWWTVLYNVEQTIQRGEPEDHSIHTCVALQNELAMDTPSVNALYNRGNTSTTASSVRSRERGSQV